MRIAIATCAALVLLGGCGSDGDDAANISSRATTSTSAVEETTTSSALPEETTTTTAGAAAAPTTRAPSARAAAPATTARPQAAPAPTSPPPQPATTAAPPPPPPPAAPDITIQNFTFNPPALNAAVGKAVMVKNLDAATHTWTADDNSWNSNNLAKDQTYSHTFTKAGTFAYHCAIHPSMKGTVNVR